MFVRKYAFWMVLIVSAILLSVATVYAQVNEVTLHFIKNQQEKVHLQMMSGTAGNPWQYRILGDWIVDYLINLLDNLGVNAPKANAYIVFRFMQCVLIFISAGIYYRKLSIPLYTNLVGLSVLAWGMSHSLYNSDLSLNIFFDVGFYLIAAIFIMDGKFLLLPLLMVLAALNRETSGLIPLMLVFYVFFSKDSSDKLKKTLTYATISMVVFIIVFSGLRLFYGEQSFLTADGYYPGIGLFVLNITRWVTWEQLLITLGVIPILAIIAYPSWSRTLKVFFWVVVPIWFGVHFFAALVAETRLFLVPQALIFIPGVLLGLSKRTDPDTI